MANSQVTANFIMSGNAVISGNTGSYGGGGGVINSEGTFTMNGGEIRSNTVPDGMGGGVSNYYGVFTMRAGTISDNTATIGGGISGESRFEEASVITINGGYITNNTSTLHGGGVNNANGSFLTVNGGEISSNTSQSGMGGGVYNWGDFTMNDGEISGNTDNDLVSNYPGTAEHNDGLIGVAVGLNRTIFRVISAEQMGGVSGTDDTTAIRITFDVPVTGLRARDIALGSASLTALAARVVDVYNYDDYTWYIYIEDILVGNGESIIVGIASFPGYGRYINNPDVNAIVFRHIPPAVYTVRFVLSGSTVMEGSAPIVQYIPSGGNAVLPTIVERMPWWRLDGWDNDYRNITSDITITAQWTFVGTHIDGMTLDVEDFELIMGTTRLLSANVTPTNATQYSTQWTSDDPSIASVNFATGLVSAISPGTTVIRVRVLDGYIGVPYFNDYVTVRVVSRPTPPTPLPPPPQPPYIGTGNGGNYRDRTPSTPILSPPINVRLNDTILSWDAVTNATGYRIYVGSRRRSGIITATNFDLTTLELSEGTLAIRVRAIYDGTGFRNSALSTAVSFVVQAPHSTPTRVPIQTLASLRFISEFIREIVYFGHNKHPNLP